jgi:hypothetical protein
LLHNFGNRGCFGGFGVEFLAVLTNVDDVYSFDEAPSYAEAKSK